MVQVEDTEYPNMKRIPNSSNDFFAQFYPIPTNSYPNYPMKNSDKWRLEVATYYKSTGIKPLKIKRKNQTPRWKTIAYCDTIEECVKIVEQYK